MLMQIRVPVVLFNFVCRHLSRELHLSAIERKEPKVARADVDVCTVHFHSSVRQRLVCEQVRCSRSFYLQYLHWDDCAGDCKHEMPRFAPEVSAYVLLQCLRRSLS